MRKVAHHLGVGLAASVLVACGGGGGGGASPVKLTTEEDVLRELGNIAVLYLDSAAPASTMTGPRHSGARQTMKSRLRHGTVTAKSVSPKAAETFECTVSGTTSYEGFTEVARSLPLFAVSPTVDYDVYIDNDCVEGDESGTYASDGRYESGSNYAYVGENPFYEYDVYGTGSSATTFAYETTNYTTSYSLKGRFESRLFGGVYEERASFRFGFDGVAEDTSFSVAYQLGDGNGPFVVVDDGQGFSLDGGISYSSDFCEGGKVVYDTLQPLTFGSDEVGSFINGGQLELTAGSHSVLLTFQSDGDVTYSIDDGAPGEITRAELDTVGDECGINFGAA